MMSRLRILTGCLAVALALALAAPAPQRAMAAGLPSSFDIRSFNDLTSVCGMPSEHPLGAAAKSLCSGYLAGVLDFHMLDTAGTRRNYRLVCLPQPVPSRAAVIDEMLGWAHDHPKSLGEPAPNGVLRFFASAYPCGKHRVGAG